MSFPYFVNNKILTFSEYVLSESISFKNKIVKFGSDKNFRNREWLILHNDLYLTFVELNGNLYCVTFIKSNGVISFSRAIEKINIDKIKDIHYLDKVFKDDRHETRNILKFFW